MKFFKITHLLGNTKIQVAILLINLIFGVFGIFNFVFNYKLTENLLLQTSLDQQLIISQSGAASIESFIKNIQNELYSYVFSFANIDKNTPIDTVSARKEFRNYIQRSAPLITSVSFYDETGKLLILEDVENKTNGEDSNFANYDFVKWSKDPGSKNKVFITKPYISKIGSSVGENIMTVATPVYFSNKFRGTLAIRFLLSRFSKSFIEPLDQDKDDKSFIVDSTGLLVAGNNVLIGKNIFDYSNNLHWKGSRDFSTKLGLALKKNESKMTLSFEYPGQQVNDYLAAVSRIDVPNTDNDLFLVTLSSKDSISRPLSPLQDYMSKWPALGLIITAVGGILLILIRYFNSKK